MLQKHCGTSVDARLVNPYAFCQVPFWLPVSAAVIEAQKGRVTAAARAGYSTSAQRRPGVLILLIGQRYAGLFLVLLRIFLLDR